MHRSASQTQFRTSPQPTLDNSNASDSNNNKANHPQSQSPLFNRFPPEIRSVIWTYCVLAYNDLNNPYPVDTLYCRPPEFTHHRVVDTSILRTCRAVYEESKDMPVSVNTYVFYNTLKRPPKLGKPYKYTAFVRLWELVHPPPDRVRRIHLITDESPLFSWDSSLDEHLSHFRNVESLTITLPLDHHYLSARDYNRGNIDPKYVKGKSMPEMQELWHRAKRGQKVPFKSGSWALTIGKLRKLKSLVLEFESTKGRESELKDLVALAQLWKFPQEFAYRSLQTGKRVPGWRYWQGPKIFNWRGHADEEEAPELVVVKIFYYVVQTSEVELDEPDIPTVRTYI